MEGGDIESGTGNGSDNGNSVKAFVISAMTRSRNPKVGVFIGNVQPDAKMLKRMEIPNVLSMEEVELVGTAPTGSTLYLFDKSPAAKAVKVASVNPDGTLGSIEHKTGEPHSILPELKGHAADKFINPRNAPSRSDFPKDCRNGGGRRSSMHPDKRIPESQAGAVARRL
jgi:hypothetical protein